MGRMTLYSDAILRGFQKRGNGFKRMGCGRATETNTNELLGLQLPGRFHFAKLPSKVKTVHESRTMQPTESGLLIDVKPAINIQSLIVVVLRLMAVNFLLQVAIQLTTPLLV